MTRIYHPGYLPGGRWQVVSTTNGIDDRRNEGPRWDTAKQAAAYVTRLESMEVISPLRDPVTSSGPNERADLGGSAAGSSVQSGSSDPASSAAGPPDKAEPSPAAGTLWASPLSDRSGG